MHHPLQQSRVPLEQFMLFCCDEEDKKSAASPEYSWRTTVAALRGDCPGGQKTKMHDLLKMDISVPGAPGVDTQAHDFGGPRALPTPRGRQDTGREFGI